MGNTKAKRFKKKALVLAIVLVGLILLTFAPLFISDMIDARLDKEAGIGLDNDCSVEIDDGYGAQKEPISASEPSELETKEYQEYINSLPPCDEDGFGNQTLMYVETLLFVLPIVFVISGTLVALHYLIKNKLNRLNRCLRLFSVPLIGFGLAGMTYLVAMQTATLPQCEAGGPQLGGPENCIIGANIGAGLLYYFAILLLISTVLACVTITSITMFRKYQIKKSKKINLVKK